MLCVPCGAGYAVGCMLRIVCCTIPVRCNPPNRRFALIGRLEVGVFKCPLDRTFPNYEDFVKKER